MSESEPLTPGEREFERAISGLNPSRPSLDPLAIAFDAGRASGTKSQRIWQSASALLLLTVVAMQIVQTPPQPGRAPETTDSRLAQIDRHDTQLAGYVAIRNDMLDRGVIALPDSRTGPIASPDRAGTFDSRKL